MKPRGISARLGRLFIIQLAVVGLATIVGVFVTQVIVQDMLTRQALNVEADFYWRLIGDQPQAPLPNTANLTGYLLEGNTVRVAPGVTADAASRAQIESFPPGYGPARLGGRHVLVHVSEQADARLVLVFEGDQVSDLAFFFGLLPLSIVLLLIYVVLFLVYRSSQRALSPVVQLANRLESVHLDRTGHAELDLEPLRDGADAEVVAMIDAVQQFTERLEAAVERERVFTRDAGHELRTPVAVFKGSLDLLEQTTDRPPFEQKALARMRRTVADMESLLETLLLLAREEATALPAEPLVVNEVIAGQVELLRGMADAQQNLLQVREHAELRLHAPEKVVEILLGNLLRNALTYTREGTVTVVVAAGGVRVEDTGIGMSEDELQNAFEPFFRAEPSRERTRGHGLGLSIVRRLATQFGWQIEALSRVGEGTSVSVVFDRHAAEPALTALPVGWVDGSTRNSMGGARQSVAGAADAAGKVRPLRPG